MATVEEVLAKADAWEKAGKPENAAKLRAYAETLKGPKYDAATVEAKATEWEKAGDTEKAAKLRSYAATLPKAEAPKAPVIDAPQAPPAGQTEAEMRASRFAQFEAGYGHFFVGQYIESSLSRAGGATDADWVYLQTTLSL